MKNNRYLIPSLSLSLLFLLSSCVDSMQDSSEKTTAATVSTTMPDNKEQNNGNGHGVEITEQAFKQGYAVAIQAPPEVDKNPALLTGEKKQAVQETLAHFQQGIVEDIQAASGNIHDVAAMDALSAKLEKDSEQYKRDMLATGKALMQQDTQQND